MAEVVLFGGTTEGRELAELLQKNAVETLVCVATGYGEALLAPDGTLRVHTGRLDADGMAAVLTEEKPTVVIDATHPYAAEVSRTIRAVCERLEMRYLRVRRESIDGADCVRFADMRRLITWLNTTPGVIFSTFGAKEVAALAQVEDFAERVWLRMLPLEESLRLAREAGFPPKHIICMQGPFSQEVNEVMFRAAGADILLTKESGRAGGFQEKLAAARACGMTVVLLERPEDADGLTLQQIKTRIEGNRL